MTTETKLRGGIALSLLVLVMMTYLYFEKDRVYVETSNQLKLEQNKVDSLQSEVFILNHEIGINELVIDELSHTAKYKELPKDYEKELNSNKYE